MHFQQRNYVLGAHHLTMLVKTATPWNQEEERGPPILIKRCTIATTFRITVTTVTITEITTVIIVIIVIAQDQLLDHVPVHVLSLIINLQIIMINLHLPTAILRKKSHTLIWQVHYWIALYTILIIIITKMVTKVKHLHITATYLHLIVRHLKKSLAQ